MSTIGQNSTIQIGNALGTGSYVITSGSSWSGGTSVTVPNMNTINDGGKWVYRKPRKKSKRCQFTLKVVDVMTQKVDTHESLAKIKLLNKVASIMEGLQPNDRKTFHLERN